MTLRASQSFATQQRLLSTNSYLRSFRFRDLGLFCFAAKKTAIKKPARGPVFDPYYAGFRLASITVYAMTAPMISAAPNRARGPGISP